MLDGADQGSTSAHALAEAYAVITRFPKPLRVTQKTAALLLEENYLKHFEIVELTGSKYGCLIIGAGQAGWVGGLIYDAIHVSCATKAAVQRLYSWNVHHLQSVASEAFRSRIVVP